MIQEPEELLRFKFIDTQHDIPNAIRKVQRMKTHDASGRPVHKSPASSRSCLQPWAGSLDFPGPWRMTV